MKKPKKNKKKRNKKKKDPQLFSKSAIEIFDHDLESYKTPGSFKNKYSGKSVLLIGTGPSSKKLIQYKEEIKNKFDVVIGVNFSILDFEDILDFHVIMEKKPTRISTWMNKNQDCRLDLLRVFNWQCIKLFDPRFNFVRSSRGMCKKGLDAMSCDDGMLFGYEEIIKGATVMLQALHFACSLGCNKIHLIGAEFCFENQRYYHENQNDTNLSIHKPLDREGKLLRIVHNDKDYFSITPYVKSAECIDKFIVDQCKNIGINVIDFSGGLITEANRLEIDKFMVGVK